MISSVAAFFISVQFMAAPIWLGPKPPNEVKRIVSLAPSMTELVFSLHEGDRVVGVTRYATWPEAVKTLPKVGGFIDPDIESIVRLKPDLVLSIPTSGGADRMRQIGKMGVSVLVLPAQTLEELWAAIDFLGELLGRGVEAKAMRQTMQKELDLLEKASSRRPAKRTIVALGHRPLVVAGPGSFVDSFLGALGMRNVVMRGGNFPQIDLEALVDFRPELIFDMTLKSEEEVQSFWQAIPMMGQDTKNNIVVLQDDALLRPGPRLVQGLKSLHLQLWGEP